MIRVFFRKLIQPKSLVFFALRLLWGTLFIALFFILTQDIQIFPGVLSGIRQKAGEPTTSLPKAVEEFFVETLDRETIQVWHIPADISAEPVKGVLVLFHGNADSLLGVSGFQQWLAKQGLHTYSFEYRGYGRSSGWPSEEGLGFDSETVLGLVKTRHDLKALPLIYFGISIGSGPASYLASRHEPDVLALVSPFSSMKEIVAEQPFVGFLAPFLWYSFPVQDFLSGLRNTCIILAHGHADRVIPSSHTEKLSSSLSREGVYTLYSQKARHNDVLAFLGAPILNHILSCLKSGDEYS